MSELKQALKQLLGGDTPLTGVLFTATVKSVDWSKRECTVTLPDGREIDEVRLRAVADGNDTGIAFKPKVNSEVTVGLLEDSNDILAVLLYTEIDTVELIMPDIELTMENGKLKIKANEIEFNGGNNYGLVLVQNLVNKINAIEDKLSNHQHLYIDTNGAASTTGTTTSNGSQVISPTTTRADLENTKITQ